jgi:hypothetical protein
MMEAGPVDDVSESRSIVTGYGFMLAFIFFLTLSIGHMASGRYRQIWQLDVRLISEIDSKVFPTWDTLSIIHTFLLGFIFS